MAVLAKSASTKVTDPESVKAPEPSVIAPVTSPGVMTGLSLVPTIVTVTVEVSMPFVGLEWSFTEMV